MAMVIYQSDYKDITLPERSQLCISSVPLDLLLNDSKELFRWIRQNIHEEGLVIIDMPALLITATDPVERSSYYMASKLGAQANGWSIQWHYVLPDFYKARDSQVLVAFTRWNHPSDIPKEILYRPYNAREMRHECEFDQTLIQYLIENFSGEGEVVVDPFCGTGIVPRMAHALKRHGIGIDMRCPFTNQNG